MPHHATTTGASRLAERPHLIGEGKFGLLTNFTGTMPDLGRNIDAFLAAGVNLTALFGPEHGLSGSVQAGETEGNDRDPVSGLPLFETYLKQGAELDELIGGSGVDAVIFDMQDIGVRYYTYVWSMYDCMLSAARIGRRFIVLDRPNPLGGSVTDGPGLDPEYASFVGRIDLPLRHGLTVAELAVHLNERILPRVVGRQVDLHVVTMEGWDPSADFDSAGLPWVPPSPNMPTLDTAFAFCGTGLFEGTNVSEGRGTTRPFEMIGAPYVDGRLADALRALELPGVAFRETWFVPTFHKYSGQTVRGVQLHVVDRRLFDPIRCGVSMLALFAQLYPDDFAFLAPGRRVESGERGYAIDRLWGSGVLRTTVESGGDPRVLLSRPTTPESVYPAADLLYSRDV